MEPKSKIALLIGIIGTLIFTCLLLIDKIGPPIYLALMILLALTSFVINGFNRLREVDLKNLKMTLDQVNEVKIDLYEKAETVKKFGENMADLTAYQTTRVGRFAPDDLVERIYAARNKIKAFLELLGSNKDTIAAITEPIDETIMHDLKEEITRKVIHNLLEVRKTDKGLNVNKTGDEIKDIMKDYSAGDSRNKLIEFLKKYNMFEGELDSMIDKLEKFIANKVL